MYNKDFFKHECGLYVAHAPQWSQDKYGQDSLEKGDMIYATCRKIIDDNDTSPWAYNALEIMADLLFKRKRWPDSLNHELDAKNFIHAKLTGRYRSQKNMTRDPYILFYALCVHLNRPQFIETVTIPIHLYSRRTWVWRKTLIALIALYDKEATEEYADGLFNRYVMLEMKGLKSQRLEFTRQLVYYRANAIGIVGILISLGPISDKYLYT